MEIKNKEKQYNLEERVTVFARRVRDFSRKAPRSLENQQDLPQVVRSSGSVAANYMEANAALSKKDFLMRVRICRKEAKESALWFDLIYVNNENLVKEKIFLMDEAKQLMYILGAILKNSQKF